VPVIPPGLLIATYCVIVNPPLIAGAVYDTLIEFTPETYALILIGGSGGLGIIMIEEILQFVPAPNCT
jgi:hypothetical protein